MRDDFALPVSELWPIEIVNLGPIIDPPFSDALNWSGFLVPVETRSVDFERLDPSLSDEDGRQAVELAFSSNEVRGRLEGKRHEFMSVGLRAIERDVEYPVVVVYDYSDGAVLEVMVDLEAQRVLDVRVEKYQPPATAAEERQAIELVRQDGRLQSAREEIDTGRGIVVEDENFRSSRYGHRLIDLRFGPEDRRSPTAYAIVDLTDQVVVRTGSFAHEEPS